MAQKRYFDYQSKIRSKTSAESLALASAGIGVKYGFNKVSVSGNSFIISSDNTITLTNSETGALDEVKHVVITPDGIITAETEDISIALSDFGSIGEANTYYFVLASHQHIESIDALVNTSYILIKAKGDISSLLGVDKTINDWYDELLKSYPTFNKNTTVIAAIIYHKTIDEITSYVPLNNSWPSKISKLESKIEDTIKKLNIKSFTASFGESSGTSREIILNGYTLNNNTKILVLSLESSSDEPGFDSIPCIKNIVMSTVYTPFEKDNDDNDNIPYIVGSLFDNALNFSANSKLEGNIIKCSISGSFNNILRCYAIESV